VTTIAYDGDTIAADGLAVAGDMITDHNFRKLRVVKDKIYAVCGAAAMIAPLIEWHQAGADARAAPELRGGYDWSMLVVSLDHALLYFMEVPYPEDMPAPFAMGTGRSYARAAMLLGKSAKQAVEFAAEHDINTGGEIMELAVEPATFRMPRAPKKAPTVKPLPSELVRHSVPSQSFEPVGRQISVYDPERRINVIKYVREEK
jgi:ATP-dependent protease HslVU (ClpYQ) peptidase subunit